LGCGDGLVNLDLWLASGVTQMAWFFTKAALLTFGGAYAVCLRISRGSWHYHWLTPHQMIDGLRWETTPGP